MKRIESAKHTSAKSRSCLMLYIRLNWKPSTFLALKASASFRCITDLLAHTWLVRTIRKGVNKAAVYKKCLTSLVVAGKTNIRWDFPLLVIIRSIWLCFNFGWCTGRCLSWICQENMGWSDDCSIQSPQVIHGIVIWVMNLDVEVK
jgi:hypothetical protein